MKKFIGFVCVAAAFAIAIQVAKNGGPAGSAGREPANAQAAFTGNVEQQRAIDDMNAIVLGIKTREDVLPAAAKIVEMAKAKDPNRQMPGVQLYAAIAAVVPDAEGIFYRCRAFVEPSDWIHMGWLYGLRDFSYNDYLYGPHVKALFDFVTHPSERAGKPFAKVSDFQDYLLNSVAPKLQAGLALAGELEKLPAENFEFMFDRTVFVGQGDGLRFLDPAEAKKMAIKPYLYTLMFELQRAVGSIYYLSALDLNDLPQVANRILRQTTINSFRGDLRLGEPAKGVTPMMTYEIIKQTRNFLGWRASIPLGDKQVQAQELLDKSFYYGVTSAYYQLAAYVCNVKYPSERARGVVLKSDRVADCSSFSAEGNPEAYFVANGSDYLFNPNSMILGFKKKYHMFRDRARAYSEAQKGGYSTIVSDVTGQSVRVNLKALFNAKTSQRDFLPTAYLFANAPAYKVPELGGVTGWNYDHGKPSAFKDYTFGGFFDGAQVSDSKSLYRAMTTVLYTDSIAPFAVFIRVPSTARFVIPPSEIINQ